MVQRRVTKTCCSRKAIVVTSEKPVRRNHIQMFRQAGFNVPENYVKSGLLYAKKGGFVATATFGICNANIRCSGGDCEDIIRLFEGILAKIEREP